MFKFPKLKNNSPSLQRVIDKHGGIFESEYEHPWFESAFVAVDSRIRRCVNFSHERIFKKNTHSLEYVFIKQSDINAFCATSIPAEGNFDLIGINYGIVFTLDAVFSKLLSHPDVLPSVGNAMLEERNQLPFPKLSTDALADSYPPETRNHPLCSIRSAYAQELVLVAVEVLFFHEIAHISNGHLEFFRNNFQLSALSEIEDMSSPQVSSLMRQTLEMDADLTGILYALNSAWSKKDMVANLRSQNKGTAITESQYGSEKCSVDMVLFSAYVLWRLFQENYDESKVYKGRHPPVSIRLGVILQQMHAIFAARGEYYNYSGEQFDADHVSFIFNAEHAISNILGKEIDASMIISGLEGVDAYSKNFSQEWKRIGPMLSKYTRGVKLAPFE